MLFGVLEDLLDSVGRLLGVTLETIAAVHKSHPESWIVPYVPDRKSVNDQP